MKLIADSGSTKTEWLFIDDHHEEIKIRTTGINPFFQSEEEIKLLIEQELFNQINALKNIHNLHFYGAGCASGSNKEVLKNIFSKKFPFAHIEVESDLLGAARSLLQHSSGIACIIGTGSNSCFYNGTEITENVAPLGFILGDEGGGAVLGKKLVSDYLKKQMSEELFVKFGNQYRISIQEVLNRIYKQPFPNRYLASFAPFLSENITEPYAYNLVFDSFLEFFIRNVMQYDYTNHTVHFTGSIAHHFRDVLEVSAYEYGLTIGEIVQSPLKGLISYHQN